MSSLKYNYTKTHMCVYVDVNPIAHSFVVLLHRI